MDLRAGDSVTAATQTDTMDFLTSTFLESPARLGVFCFLALAAMLFIRRRLEGSARHRILPIGLLAMAALFGVQSLVETDRERITAALREFVRAIEQRNPAAIAQAVSADYDCEGLSRNDLLRFISGRLARMRIYDSSLSPTIRVDGDTARMGLGARATVSIDGGVGEFHVGSWSLAWRREGDAWRLTALRPERIDGIEITRLRDLTQYAP